MKNMAKKYIVIEIKKKAILKMKYKYINKNIYYK